MSDWEDAPSKSSGWEDAPSKRDTPVTDVMNRALVAGTLGGPVDIATLGLERAQEAGKMAREVTPPMFRMEQKPMPTIPKEPVGGSEWIGKQMEKSGMVSPERRPVAELLTGLAPSVLTAGAVGIPAALSRGKQAYQTLRGTPYKESVGQLTTSAEDIAKSLMAQERTAGREQYGAQRQARLKAQTEAESARKSAESLRAGLAPEDASVTGNKLMSDIKDVSDRAWNQRKTLADETYSKAWESTRAKQSKGDYWQQSPSGQDFFSTLRKKIQTSDVTPVGSSEENEIRNIIQELQGKRTGETRGFSFDPSTGLMSTPSVPSFAPLDIKAVVEQLRKLREAANGFPEEGFKAISQKRAQAMAKSLEESIAKWDDSLRKADQTYKLMSERLYPEQTARGEAILSRQRYDLNELARDPKNATKLFFTSKQGVEDLTRLLGGDSSKVAQYARQHVFNELSTKKTAKEVESWVTSRNNVDWMNEIPGLRQQVESYAKSLKDLETKATSAQDLSKTMKTAGRRTAQEMTGRIKELQNEAFLFQNADPNKVVSLARDFGKRLQRDGIASSEQIADFERQIRETERLYEGREKARRVAILAAKIAGLGYGSYEATRLMQGK